MMLSDLNPLILLIIYPIVAGIVCLLVPDRFKALIKAAAGIAVLISLAVSVLIFLKKPMTWESGRYTLFVADNLSS
ncbi:MAG: hypothetical protein Q7S07_02365, partial [Candidatus Omnitrophota bacterium]|nr:hypothetical protein [Candidatus Omnitrophota bacterium]